MALPNRTRAALPQHAGTALARPSQAIAPHYRQAARNVWGNLKTRAHSAGSRVAAHGSRARAAAGGALARASGRPDSLGGIFARSLSPGLAVGVLGGIDGSPWGQRFTAWTNGLIEPSTALALLGGVARGAEWDRKFLGKHVERINVNLLTGMFPVALYKLGRWTPGAIMRGIDGAKKTPSAKPAVSGLPTGANGKASDTGIQVEVVPGEQTVS